MIVEERMRTFINSLDTGNTPFLDELECSALSEGVPIIRKEMQSFIKTAENSGSGDGRRLLHTSYV